MNNTCPNGYICINHFQGIIILIVGLAVLYVFNNDNYRSIFGKPMQQQSIQMMPTNQESPIQMMPSNQEQPIQEQNNHDRRVISNPLYPPLQRGISINEETRESGGDYQQLGILSKNAINNGEGTPGNNTDSVVLPLYGKPTYRGSNKWLYYTETDKLHPVKIPVTYKNKDCTDDQGCDEIYDGDDVVIPSYNGDFKVKIYKMNKPRYIPFV
jgi:hypothetical protein